MNSGGPGVTKINRGRYSVSGGQEIIFTDDSATPESVGCTDNDLFEILVDRLGIVAFAGMVAELLGADMSNESPAEEAPAEEPTAKTETTMKKEKTSGKRSKGSDTDGDI